MKEEIFKRIICGILGLAIGIGIIGISSDRLASKLKEEQAKYTALRNEALARGYLEWYANHESEYEPILTWRTCPCKD